ncbi:hypothetical protein Nepgr_020490 [Nepenthes gracilis]|uniref:Uncharacterized protein n=1 Tax=Nepenthes gracilis TaxID=150966 RepID=A0AAD3SXQ3_NEPGR|nr:hypothetical protein Nepgr_020490 [Nepenthes gracilis]
MPDFLLSRDWLAACRRQRESLALLQPLLYWLAFPPLSPVSRQRIKCVAGFRYLLLAQVRAFQPLGWADHFMWALGLLAGRGFLHGLGQFFMGQDMGPNTSTPCLGRPVVEPGMSLGPIPRFHALPRAALPFIVF